MEERTQTEGLATAEMVGTGAPGRTFTQEEVNKIVSERLQKERARAASAEPAASLAAREKALEDRESRMSCLEYLREQGLQEELLEILDTKNPEGFRQQVSRLVALYPVLDSHAAPPPAFSLAVQGSSDTYGPDPFAEAFGRK